MLKRIADRKERKKRFWMGFLLVFLMIFSGAGILIGSRSDSSDWEYNGFKFRQIENYYIGEFDQKEVIFNFLPHTLLTINTSGNVKDAISRPMLYLGFDPDSSVQNLLYIDLVRNDFERNSDAVIVSTIMKESDIYALPVMTCDNATQYVPMIYFKVANETSIKEDNNCIILSGQGIQFLQLRDMLLYIKYGVIDV
ncbi:hypothetical protein ACFLTH_09000 [Bacteroidota bacterium]